MKIQNRKSWLDPEQPSTFQTKQNVPWKRGLIDLVTF